MPSYPPKTSKRSCPTVAAAQPSRLIFMGGNVDHCSVSALYISTVGRIVLPTCPPTTIHRLPPKTADPQRQRGADIRASKSFQLLRCGDDDANDVDGRGDDVERKSGSSFSTNAGGDDDDDDAVNVAILVTKFFFRALIQQVACFGCPFATTRRKMCVGRGFNSVNVL